jgi:hypothetical protein
VYIYIVHCDGHISRTGQIIRSPFERAVSVNSLSKWIVSRDGFGFWWHMWFVLGQNRGHGQFKNFLLLEWFHTAKSVNAYCYASGFRPRIGMLINYHIWICDCRVSIFWKISHSKIHLSILNSLFFYPFLNWEVTCFSTLFAKEQLCRCLFVARRILRSSRPQEIFQPPQQGFYHVLSNRVISLPSSHKTFFFTKLCEGTPYFFSGRKFIKKLL